MGCEGERDGFRSRGGFIVSCIGSSVGMGNIWRFPAMVSLFGGLTFIVPYLFFVVLIALTGVMAEFALGRSAKTGPVGAFGRCTEMRFGNERIGKAIGLIPIMGSLALAIGYTCVMAWIFDYTFMAFNGELISLGQDMGSIGGLFDSIATSGGANVWVVVAVVTSLGILALGVSRGIEKANSVMMPVLFLLFIGLMVYIATLPGASAGYSYIFSIDTEMLGNPLVWIFAFGQAFFSLSVAGNGSVIYGSYLDRKESIPYSAGVVATFDTTAALLASMVIIPAMAAGGSELTGGGPGLMFIHLVNVFNGMPMGQMIGVVFFVCVLFAGLSSIINLYEAPIEYLQQRFETRRATATAAILAIGCIVALCIQGIVSQWMDAVSIFICPLGALLAGAMFFWVAGRKFAEDEVSEGAKRRIGGWFFPLGKYVYCSLTLVALVAGALLGGIG